ncbi:hypothetical protein ACHAXN_010258 [Cyclotella atomus]
MATTGIKSEPADRNVKWRARKKAEALSIANEVNAKRAELNLPSSSVGLTLKHCCPFKGMKRPGYNPPDEEMALMTKQQLSQWRREERRKRKVMAQHENRMRKKALLNKMKEELDELNRRIEEKNQKKDAQVDRKAKEMTIVSIKSEVESGSYNDAEEALAADPYIDNDVDAASWVDGDVILASADEIASVFDDEL